jgi:ABC-type dipeptide/oligopeptide/nickel transport systems, permease components
VTIVGLQIGGIIEGAVVTETVFTWPGVGRLAVESIFNRDYTVVQGIVLLAAFSYLVANLLVDLVYGWLDPRISFA